ncbi:nitric oxide reductase D protein [Thalassococcus sp. CAU 1522]|uniref:Nitric oxide reductase D protein n=1 Tax=Thalassococcus arenae TaxID=2851652 RepID=A0ABS6ND71_9RHOB|nr:VWA domain-containing protein [Thalassococcus arenae]MBV2361637.1 nitric oxide reductase D protein [Thalassococcus arenae]
MTRIEIEPWEPEETVGKLWHAFASRLDAPEEHRGAAVDLSEIGGRLAVFFRALGGAPSVELRPVPPERSHHRLSFLRMLGAEADYIPQASFDGEALRLPESLAVFPAREQNAALYLWLAATAAFATPPEAEAPEDPLQADLAAILRAQALTARALEEAPGLRALHDALCHAHLAARPAAVKGGEEGAVEALIRRALGDQVKVPALTVQMLETPQAQRAPYGYKPFRPVPLWPDLRKLDFSATTETETAETEGKSVEAGGKTRRAKRKQADLAERKDSLILHKFEAILSWTEFLNLNRRVEDDDPDSAKKAADDLDEIGLGQISKAPATKLKLHLDLSPEDVDRERLSAEITYPEWEARSGTYLPDHVKVYASQAEPCADVPSFRADPKSSQRIQRVKRQFEALRPGRVFVPGMLDGDELDLEAAVRTRSDLAAGGEGSDRIWRQSRPEARSLAVSILLDISRSTESAVADRAVIDIEREALAALAWGLDACGDDFAIHAFSSLKRHRVYLQQCKGFGEKMDAQVEARIGGLKPGFYTRLGAAIRHASAGLAEQQRKRRLLLVITDGKPNDLDHYEGRHGIEDTAMAVREARRKGQAVFGVTIDREAKSWFPRLFGQGGFQMVPHPDHLTAALPAIYRQLVGA